MNIPHLKLSKLLIYARKNILLTGGILLLIVSVSIFSWIYYPVASLEVKYWFSKPSTNVQIITQNTTPTIIGQTNPVSTSEVRTISPVDDTFSIVIPKIDANSKVIDNVDPFNESEYQTKLKEGIAHAKGTSHPGEKGRTFLFAHSSATAFNATRYNAVFYLLDKLNEGDEIYVMYQNNTFLYKVREKKIVLPTEVGYIEDKQEKEELTLMTCWPAGSNAKRLLVFADPIK